MFTLTLDRVRHELTPSIAGLTKNEPCNLAGTVDVDDPLASAGRSAQAAPTTTVITDADKLASDNSQDDYFTSPGPTSSQLVQSLQLARQETTEAINAAQAEITRLSATKSRLESTRDAAKTVYDKAAGEDERCRLKIEHLRRKVVDLTNKSDLSQEATKQILQRLDGGGE